MKWLINRFDSDVFFRKYLIYFSGSMIVAFLNYIFHPLLGRILSPSDFGDIQALISLIAQSSVILGAFSVIVVNVTANIDNENERNAIISELQKISFYLIGFIFIILLLSISFIKNYFNFETFYPLFGLALILPISAMASFRSSFLQGKGDFYGLSIAQIISSSGRLVLSLLFVYLGFKVFGATLGIVLTNLLSLIYLYFKTKDNLILNRKVNIHVLEKGSISKELIYGILVFFSTILITIFYTSDVLIIKHYFDSNTAGLYSGISAIAKILFFAIGPTSAVLLSSIKLKNSFKENSKNLSKSLIISLIIGILGMFTFYMFNDMVVGIMIGDNYIQYANYLPKIGLLMFLTAIANIFIYYYLALRRFFLILISIVGGISIISILLAEHSNIQNVLNSLTVSVSIIIILLVFTYAKDYINSNTRI